MLLKHRSLRECPEQIYRFFSQFCSIIHQRCASHLCLFDPLWKKLPGLFLFWGFFSRGLSFSCGIIQLEKLAVRRGCGGTRSNVSGRRRESSGFAPTLCFHTPQPYSLQLKCHHCATPPCLHGQNHPIIQAQPPAPRHLVLSASASHFQQAAVGSYCCCLADKHEKEKKTKRCSSPDLSQNSNARGTFLAKSVNKQINKHFPPPHFGSKKTCHSIQKECSLSVFSKFNRNKQWE